MLELSAHGHRMQDIKAHDKAKAEAHSDLRRIVSRLSSCDLGHVLYTDLRGCRLARPRSITSTTVSPNCLVSWSSYDPVVAPGSLTCWSGLELQASRPAGMRDR